MADIVDKKIIGTAIGFFNIVTGVSNIIVSFVLGILGKKYPIGKAFYFCLAFALLAMLFLLIFKGKDKAKKAIL